MYISIYLFFLELYIIVAVFSDENAQAQRYILGS